MASLAGTMCANEIGCITSDVKSCGTAQASPASRPNTSQAQPRNRNLLNRKQAEYLALAIEKGLVVSAEELCLRVKVEKYVCTSIPISFCS